MHSSFYARGEALLSPNKGGWGVVVSLDLTSVAKAYGNRLYAVLGGAVRRLDENLRVPPRFRSGP